MNNQTISTYFFKEKTSITAEPEELMVNETFTLQCKFNNKFNMERIIWMKEEEMLNTAKPPNCTEDGIMMKCFILMTFTSSANYSCALPFPGIEEEMEQSDQVLVKSKSKVKKSQTEIHMTFLLIRKRSNSG